MHLCYTILDNVLQNSVQTKPHRVIIKRKMNNALRNIPKTSDIWWCLDSVGKRHYFNTENSLSFRLSKSHFIINQFVKISHCILKSIFSSYLKHYLDNSMVLLSAINVTPNIIWIKLNNYSRLTDILRIPQ